MTARSTWKRLEREVAWDQGTERTPLSGSASRHTGADTLHPQIYSEAKYRKKWALWTLYEIVKEQATREDKIPALFFKQKGKRGYLIVCHSEDWFKLLAEYAQNGKR